VNEFERREGTKLPSWETWDTNLLLILIFLFVVTRLLWISLNPETASYWEESYRWVAAHEILNGMTQPLLDYQADHYQGGSLFIILLVLPFLWLGVEPVFSLKLVALLLSVATLAVLFALGRYFFGRLVAVFAGLAYVAGPPLVAFWGLVSMGFHTESTLFSLLQISIFLGLLTGRWRHPAGWMAFGLACGAGFSFTYITALSAAACALTWLFFEGPPRCWKELGLAGAGLAIGLLPWIAYNTTHDFVGLARIAEVFGAQKAPDLWRVQSFGKRLVDLFVSVPVYGLLDPSKNSLSTAGRVVIAVAFLVPASLALLAAFFRMGRVLRWKLSGSGEPVDEFSRREFVFGVYAVLFSIAYLSSRFTLDPVPTAISYRLFPPLVVLLMIPVALSAQQMITAGEITRRVAKASAVICLLSTATATFAYSMHPADPGAELSLTQGYIVFGRLLHRKYGELPDALTSARQVPGPASRSYVFWGIGWEAQCRFEVRGDYEDLLTRVAEVPEAERVSLLAGMLWGAQARVDELTRRVKLDTQDHYALERMQKLARIVEPLVATLKAKHATPNGS